MFTVSLVLESCKQHLYDDNGKDLKALHLVARRFRISPSARSQDRPIIFAIFYFEPSYVTRKVSSMRLSTPSSIYANYPCINAFPNRVQLQVGTFSFKQSTNSPTMTLSNLFMFFIVANFSSSDFIDASPSCLGLRTIRNRLLFFFDHSSCIFNNVAALETDNIPFPVLILVLSPSLSPS